MLYAVKVRELLPCTPELWSIDQIQYISESLTNALHHSAELIVPPKMFRKNSRPNWNNNLRNTQSQSKASFQLWSRAGKPSNPLHPLRLTYKADKRKFTRALRQFKRNETEEFYKLLDLDSDKCFFHIRSRLDRVEIPTSHLVVNNQSFVDDDGIREAWATYFELLATPDWDMFCPDH